MFVVQQKRGAMSGSCRGCQTHEPDANCTAHSCVMVAADAHASPGQSSFKHEARDYGARDSFASGPLVCNAVGHSSGVDLVPVATRVTKISVNASRAELESRA